MQLKFNNGNGAIICDKCRVIIQERFSLEEFAALRELVNTEKEWFCKDCNLPAYREQERKLMETLMRIYEQQATEISSEKH